MKKKKKVDENISSTNNTLPKPIYDSRHVMFWRAVSKYSTPIVLVLSAIFLESIHPTQDQRLELAINYAKTYMHTFQATVLVFFGLFVSVSIKSLETINKCTKAEVSIRKTKNMVYRLITQLSSIIISSVYLLVLLTSISSVYGTATEIKESKYIVVYVFATICMLGTQLLSIFFLISYSVILMIVYIDALDHVR